MSGRNVREAADGRPGIDATWQSFADRPYANDGETVGVVDEALDSEGEVSTEDVPLPAEGVDRPATDGQTTLDEWGWSA